MLIISFHQVTIAESLYLTVITCPPVPRAVKALANTSSAIYGTHVNYTCRPGYGVGNGSLSFNIECLDTGQWSIPSPPPCTGNQHAYFLFIFS